MQSQSFLGSYGKYNAVFQTAKIESEMQLFFTNTVELLKDPDALSMSPSESNKWLAAVRHGFAVPRKISLELLRS